MTLCCRDKPAPTTTAIGANCHYCYRIRPGLAVASQGRTGNDIGSGRGAHGCRSRQQHRGEIVRPSKQLGNAGATCEFLRAVTGRAAAGEGTGEYTGEPKAHIAERGAALSVEAAATGELA